MAAFMAPTGAASKRVGNFRSTLVVHAQEKCTCAPRMRLYPQTSQAWRSSFGGASIVLQRQAPRQLNNRMQVVTAAIFGVGAPEALLVGVVALVVFGPKGLAQAVKSLGAALRTFSPTIKELASVTNELSSTLQEQIGLDEIRNEFRNPAPTYRPPNQEKETGQASTSESSLPEGKAQDAKNVSQEAKGTEAGPTRQESDEELAAKIAESKRVAWGGKSPGDTANEQQLSSSQSAPTASAKPKDAPKAKDLDGKSAAEFSIEELEAELKRRREGSKA